jgi:hypothetical protein
MSKVKKDDKGITHNPTFVVVVGFILTSVLGGAITWFVQNSINDRLQWEKDSATRKEAVRAISNFIFERRANAVLLISALNYDSPIDDIRADKALYDKSKVQWDGSIKATTFQVINVVGPSYQKVIDGLMNSEGPVRRIFAALDDCIDQAYRAKLAGHAPRDEFADCRGTIRAHPPGTAEKIIDRELLVDRCVAAVVDISWTFANREVNDLEKRKAIDAFNTQTPAPCSYFLDGCPISVKLNNEMVTSTPSLECKSPHTKTAQ